MDWEKSAENESVEVWTAVDYVKGEQAYDDQGTPVGDVPYVSVPLTPNKIDKRLMDTVWDSAKELTQTLDQLDYLQVGRSGVVMRIAR